MPSGEPIVAPTGLYLICRQTVGIAAVTDAPFDAFLLPNRESRARSSSEPAHPPGRSQHSDPHGVIASLLAMRVGVLGATGRMGRSSCHAVLDASDLELVAAVARSGAGTQLRDLVPAAPAGLRVRGAPEDLLDAKAEVVIDFSV